MIRILDRMIIRSFLRIFAGFIIGSPILFLVGDLVDRVDNYFDNGLTVTEVATAYIYKVPQFIFWSFPTAALIAAVFTIHTMTVNREVLAAKAGGISFRRLMVPILAVGVVLSGAGLWLSEVLPVAEHRAGQILGRVNVDQQWRTDFVFRTDDGGALSVRRLTLSDRRLQGVMLSIPTGRDGVTRYIQAEEAVYSDSVGWTFRKGYVREVYLDQADRTMVYDSLRMTAFNEAPESLIDIIHDEEQMTRSQLNQMARNIERSGGDASRLHLEREQRVALAIASFVIILFGGPLATSSRRGGSAFGIGLALGTTILYMLLVRLSGAFGATGALNPLLSAWLPNIFFTVAGLVLLKRVRT
jgi:lipopolysaccharide export system permease protein